MTPGDELASRIQQFVASQVAPELVEVVTVATCRAITTLMSDPSFTSRLQIVANLQQENQWLKSQIIQLQRIVALGSAVATSKPRSSTKKASAKSSSRIQGNASRSAKAAFIKGTRQAKR